MARPNIMQRLFGAQGGMTGGNAIIPNAGLTAVNQLGQRQTVGQFPSDAPLRQPAMQYQSPLLQNAMRQSGSLPFQQPPQPETPAQPPMSMLDKIRTGLGAPSTSPMGMAINQASQALLQQSGYSPVPRTTGEIIGGALGAANKGFMAGKVLEQQEAKALAAQKQQDIENIRANYELMLKAAEADAKSGQMFEGTSSFAQSSNILIELNEKIKNKTASPAEIQAYNLAYSKLSRDTEFQSIDPETGDMTITRTPGQNLTGFSVPVGFEPRITKNKPSTKTLKDVTKNEEAISMLQNLNEYRRTILDPNYNFTDQMSGSLGFLGGPQGKAQSESEQLRLDLKLLYELGALVGGDFQILDNLLVNPNSVKAMKSGKDYLLTQLDTLERQLGNDMNRRDNELFGTTNKPVIANSLEDYNKIPNYLYVQLPNGEIRYKTPPKKGQ